MTPEAAHQRMTCLFVYLKIMHSVYSIYSIYSVFFSSLSVLAPDSAETALPSDGFSG